MNKKIVVITFVLLGTLSLFGFLQTEEAKSDDSAEIQSWLEKQPKPESEFSSDQRAQPNAQVNILSQPGTEQVNASVAYSDWVAGEVYAVWTEFLGFGASPTNIGYAGSPSGGAPGTWQLGPVIPPTVLPEAWNPDIASVPPGTIIPCQFAAIYAEYQFPPYILGLPNAIVINTSLGSGTPFPSGPGPSVVMFNAGFNWLDFPRIKTDETPGLPTFATSHIAWTEYIEGGDGDIDGNGNFFDDPADQFVIWTSFTNFGPGPAPYVSVNPPIAIGGGVVFPNAMQMNRPALAVAGVGGTPAMPPGAVYAAWMDVGSGFIWIDASELVAAGIPWGSLGGGPLPAMPFSPFGPVIVPGIKAANSVDIAIHDQLGSACDGNVYLCWTDFTGADFDIMFSSSFDGGITWMPPVVVNTVPIGDQWAPSMEVDPVSGDICIAYYDQRMAPGNAVETWRSCSPDCGQTWTDQPLSDAGPTPPVTSIFTLPGPYVGDYLGTDVNPQPGCLTGSFAGIWNDGRNGADQDIYFDPDCNCCNHDGIRGDVNYSLTGPDIADLTYLVDYMFANGPPPPCMLEADVNADCVIDITDLTYLVDYMFAGGPAPLPCP